MPTISSERLMPRAQLLKLLRELKSSRKQAKVVTIGGVAPRGHQTSWKGARAAFQSLVEDDSQRVLEIASCVTGMQSHPVTLELGPAGSSFAYTPDLLVWFGDAGALVEVKPRSKLSNAKVYTKLHRNMRGLEAHGIRLCLLLDTDVRDSGLQQTLKVLERERPARGHFRADLDSSLWDPRGRAEPSDALIERWEAAQKTCDELLERVMKRDPDELLPVCR